MGVSIAATSFCRSFAKGHYSRQKRFRDPGSSTLQGGGEIPSRVPTAQTSRRLDIAVSELTDYHSLVRCVACLCCTSGHRKAGVAQYGVQHRLSCLALELRLRGVGLSVSDQQLMWGCLSVVRSIGMYMRTSRRHHGHVTALRLCTLSASCLTHLASYSQQRRL